MEAKKNPRHDVHRLTSRNFLIGLSVSVSLAIIAFEWTTEKLNSTMVVKDDIPFESLMAIMKPVQSEPKPTQLVERKPSKIITPEKLVTTSNNESKEEPAEAYTSDESNSVSDITIPIEITHEDTTSIIVYAEVHHKSVGGYDNFYSQIGKSLRYPRQASRHEVQGKVFVEFVVDRQGKVSQMKVVKGIGSGCDEEAMRVIALTQWEPGKQRGKPVQVRMTIPVIFKIQ